jgi:hypothetical protein
MDHNVWNQLTQQQRLILKFWLPPLVSGLLAFMLLAFVGETPLIRSGGLAVVIVGVALALRRMGAVLSVIGGLTLCLSPAFWSQTGGGQGEPATIVIAVTAAALAVGIATGVSQRPYIGLGVGVIIFVALFFSQIGTPRSLRLTAFVTGWLFYLIIDMLLLTNPHPEDDVPPLLLDRPLAEGASLVRPYHTLGILLLFGIGIINDPLLTLLAPSVVLALLLARTQLPLWYWALLTIIVLLGIRGIVADYLVGQSYLLVMDRWRDASRWLIEVRVVLRQFGIVGVLLAVLGLARMARWYAPLGIVTLLAYAAYTFFGLVWIGPRREALLLPLFIIQVLWMTYAVFTLSEWIKRAAALRQRAIQIAVQCSYALLPAALLLNIINL